jgi:hypothetical protein
MSLADRLADLLPPGTSLAMGELVLCRDAWGNFQARHREDEATDRLEPLGTARDLRELAKYDESGAYRPLKTAPGLKRGWVTSADCPREFLKRLDAIYPGAFAAWCGYADGVLVAVPLRRTLDRQTGMYRFAGSIGDEDARRVVSELCSAGCLRRVAWPISEGSEAERVEANGPEIPLVCLEACTFAVGKARALAKEAYDRASAAGG